VTAARAPQGKWIDDVKVPSNITRPCFSPLTKHRMTPVKLRENFDVLDTRMALGGIGFRRDSCRLHGINALEIYPPTTFPIYELPVKVSKPLPTHSNQNSAEISLKHCPLRPNFPETKQFFPQPLKAPASIMITFKSPLRPSGRKASWQRTSWHGVIQYLHWTRCTKYRKALRQAVG